MSKKIFTGEKQNLLRLAQDIEQWLRQQDFEVQSGAGDGKFLIQARKQSTWRSLLGNNQTIDVKIDGTPENYSIEVDAGAWAKNLKDSGWAGIVAAYAAIYSFGYAAAWSASERTKIETDLWAFKDASCPACFKLGAKIGIGVYVFSHKKTDQRSTQGQLVAEQVFTNIFKCQACLHEWNDGQKTRLVEICFHCEKPGGIEFLGKEERNLAMYRENYRCNLCTNEWYIDKPNKHFQVLRALDHALSTDKECVYCLRTIPYTATRCPYCTGQQHVL